MKGLRCGGRFAFAAHVEVGIRGGGFAAHVEVRPPRKKAILKRGAVPEKMADSLGGGVLVGIFHTGQGVSDRMGFVRWLLTCGVGKPLEQFCSGKEEGARGFQHFEIVST